jgi:hypothetical protein
MRSPIEQYVIDASYVNSMGNLMFHMNDYGHRLNPDHFKSLGKRRAADGTLINFKDPAVRAFLEILGMDACSVPSPADFKTSFRYEADFQDYPDFHSQLPAIKNLAAMRNVSGWGELDKLLKLSHGVTLSVFFDEIRIHHHSDDIGPLGEDRYSIKVTEGGTSPSGCRLTFSNEWFAVASTQDFALRLVEMIMVGDLRVVEPEHRSTPLSINRIEILRGRSLVLSAVLKNENNLQAVPPQVFPLVSDGQLSKVYGDASLVKAIAMFAPSVDVRRANGLVLEDSLGL